MTYGKKFLKKGSTHDIHTRSLPKTKTRIMYKTMAQPHVILAYVLSTLFLVATCVGGVLMYLYCTHNRSPTNIN